MGEHCRKRRRYQFSLRSLLLFQFGVTPLFTSFLVMARAEQAYFGLMVVAAAVVYAAVFAAIAASRAARRSAEHRPSVVFSAVRTGALFGALFAVLALGPAHVVYIVDQVERVGLARVLGGLAEIATAELLTVGMFAVIGACGGAVTGFTVEVISHSTRAKSDSCKGPASNDD